MPFYKIKSGDNLTKIARKGGYSLEELKKANPNLDPDKLKIGQKLNLPYVNYDAFGRVTDRPEYNVVPTSRAQLVDVMTPEEGALLDAISYAEGTTYGSLFGMLPNQSLTKLEKGNYTVQEVIDMAKSGNLPGTTKSAGYKKNKDGQRGTATGRYQLLANVLEEEIKGQGIDPASKFTPELQDQLILKRLKLPRDIGPRNLRQTGLTPDIIDRLAGEFASFPFSPKAIKDSKGRLIEKSRYKDQPVKSSQSIIDTYNKALKRRR